MAKKDFLEQKYCEINQLKNLLQTYPKEYCETIIKVMEKVFDEIADYLEDEKKKVEKTVKKVVKKSNRQKIFTVDELAKFDGTNGNPPYTAINGIVYDMSEVPKWSSGNHFGVIAGKVLDNQFKQCHSDNLGIIENAKVVGTLEGSSSREELRYYRMDEISKFDGKDGTLAYVVIEGTVYDVTSMRQWFNGNHYGVSAGRDLTEYFKTCHKDEAHILKKLRIVGTIIE